MQSLFVREENRLGKNVIVGIYSLTGIFGSLVGICYRITGVAAVRKLSCVFVAASGTDGAIFIMKILSPSVGILSMSRHIVS